MNGCHVRKSLRGAQGANQSSGTFAQLCARRSQLAENPGRPTMALKISLLLMRRKYLKDKIARLETSFAVLRHKLPIPQNNSAVRPVNALSVIGRRVNGELAKYPAVMAHSPT